MKIAVVGTGSVGRRHLANLLALGCAAIAVSEHSRRSSVDIAGTEVTVVNDYEAALKDGDVAAVVIANPTALHLDYARRALAAGKHIYLEKPAAASVSGVAELAAEAGRRERIVAMGTQYRFNQQLVRLRERLEGGDAGLVVSVEAHLGENITDYHPGEDYRQSYAARSELGGGVLLTQIHQVDYLNWLFGPFTSAFGIGGRRSPLEIDVEDCVSYLLRGPNGLGVAGHLNYLERPKRVDLRVTGTGGTFIWDYFGNSLAFTPAQLLANPLVERLEFDRNAMFRAAMTDFLDALQTGKQPRATLEDGLAALRIVDAIKQSCTTGEAVQLVS